MSDKLFTEPTKVTLATPASDVPSGARLNFPVHVYPGDLPDLVVATWLATGRKRIAGTGSWGTPNLNPEMSAVHASSDFLKSLRKGDRNAPPGTNEPNAEVQRARWPDVLLYQRGFITNSVWAFVVAAVAILGAVVSFVSDHAQLGTGVALLAGVAIVNVGDALRRVRNAKSD